MASTQACGQTSRSPCGLPSEVPSKSFWHSQPSPLLTAHRTTRELPEAADVVVVGSGITGASVAHHLLNDDDSSRELGKADLSVVMLEAREACWGATGRNGGHCQPALFAHPHDPSIGHFELDNFRTLQSLISRKEIDCEFVEQPGVRAFYSRRLWDEIELAVLTVQATAPKLAELMTLVTDKAELAKLRVPTATGAVVTRVAARMWPYKFVSRILEDLVMATELRGSFNLQTFTTVETLEENGGDGWIVHTSRGTIKASKIVLATNAYTSQLLHNFADLIVPVRGQMSSLIPWSSVAEDNRVKTSFGFDGEAIDEYLIQRPNETGGHLMYGGGRQVGGPTVGISDDSVIDDDIAAYLRQSLIQRFALPEASEKSKIASTSKQSRSAKAPSELNASYEWTGIMGYSRDEHPWVGPVPGKLNLFVSAGYTGHGMPNTWLCGKAVATMVESSLLLTPVQRQTRDKVGELELLQRSAMGQAIAAGRRESANAEYLDYCGLPRSYLITEKRIKKAMEEHEDVGAVDWAEMERAKKEQRADRVPSGYA